MAHGPKPDRQRVQSGTWGELAKPENYIENICNSSIKVIQTENCNRLCTTVGMVEPCSTTFMYFYIYILYIYKSGDNFTFFMYISYFSLYGVLSHPLSYFSFFSRSRSLKGSLSKTHAKRISVTDVLLHSKQSDICTVLGSHTFNP